MKKVIIIVVCVIILCSFFGKNDTKENEIRIRVIANSDSTADIMFKESIVEYLYKNYNFNFDSYDSCDKYIKENLTSINKDLKSLSNNIIVSYQMHNFQNKAYNDIALKDGSYMTLLIQINEAKGSNYWGALYGDNCKEDTQTIIYKSFLVELFS